MFTVEIEGIDEIIGQLKTIQYLGADINTAELNGRLRKESAVNNSTLLRGFSERHNRKYLPLDNEEDEEISSAAANEIVKTLDYEFERRNISKKTKIIGKEEAKNIANQIMSKALLAAMEKVKEIITRRIENGTDLNGMTVPDLKPEYKRKKEREFGFAYPIGVATGQLIDNLSPGARNVRLKREK